MKLIDKAAVVAEIEKIIADENESIKTFEHSKNISEVQRSNARLGVLMYIRSFLDTLEVKDVNDAYKQGYNDAIDKACDAYCRLCDTKECGDTGECEWVEKFRKRLMR